MAKSTKPIKENYSTLDDEALEDKMRDEEVRLKKIKFSHAVSQIDNPLQIKQIRRDLARIKTEQRKRELGI